MSYTLLNLYNKKVIVKTISTELDINQISEEIEEEILDGEQDGIALGHEWYILETRMIFIQEQLLEIDSNVQDDFIEEILKKVNSNLIEFKRYIENKFYIENVPYKVF